MTMGDEDLHTSTEEAEVRTNQDCGWLKQVFPILHELSAPGDNVLDIFAGWGTTLVACGLSGRRAVGIEIEPER